MLYRGSQSDADLLGSDLHPVMLDGTDPGGAKRNHAILPRNPTKLMPYVHGRCPAMIAGSRAT